jgi:hypothetical protein
MNLEQVVELELAGETEEVGENKRDPFSIYLP